MAETQTAYEAVLIQARTAIDAYRCDTCGSIYECPHSFDTDLPLWALATAAVLQSLPEDLQGPAAVKVITVLTGEADIFRMIEELSA
jgi:hypothetical protein